MILTQCFISRNVGKEKEEDILTLTQKAMNTITLMANRMKRFEELLIDSGIVDTQQARKLKHDSSSYALKTLKDNKDTNANDNDNDSDSDN